MAKRRSFSKEFKRNGVQMTTEANLSLTRVAKDLGIQANVLSRICCEQEWDGLKTFRGQCVPPDEQLTRLKQDLARVKRGRDVLKNIAVFFSRDTLPGML